MLLPCEILPERVRWLGVAPPRSSTSEDADASGVVPLFGMQALCRRATGPVFAPYGGARAAKRPLRAISCLFWMKFGNPRGMVK